MSEVKVTREHWEAAAFALFGHVWQTIPLAVEFATGGLHSEGDLHTTLGSQARVIAEAEARGFARCQAGVVAGLRSEADGHRGRDDDLAQICDDFASAIEIGAYSGASKEQGDDH